MAVVRVSIVESSSLYSTPDGEPRRFVHRVAMTALHDGEHTPPGWGSKGWVESWEDMFDEAMR